MKHRPASPNVETPQTGKRPLAVGSRDRVIDLTDDPGPAGMHEAMVERPLDLEGCSPVSGAWELVEAGPTAEIKPGDYLAIIYEFDERSVRDAYDK